MHYKVCLGFNLTLSLWEFACEATTVRQAFNNRTPVEEDQDECISHDPTAKSATLSLTSCCGSEANESLDDPKSYAGEGLCPWWVPPCQIWWRVRSPTKDSTRPSKLGFWHGANHPTL